MEFVSLARQNRAGDYRSKGRLVAVPRLQSLLAVAALLLAACTTTYPEQLAALKQDPMAQLSLPGAKLERRFERDATSGGLMNMSQRANVTEVFSIANVASVDGVNAAATRAAENAGWTVEFRSELTGATQWAKTLASRKATLGITPKREGLEARLTIVLTIP
jgi:type IV pilus biogenesis protein CpaD/CtpE